MNIKKIAFAGLYVLLMIYRSNIKENVPWFGRVFLDIMPNLLAGISFPFIFIYFLEKINIRMKYLYFVSCFFCFIWLIIEEFNPVFGHSLVFDWNDICASFFGVCISYRILNSNIYKGTQ